MTEPKAAVILGFVKKQNEPLAINCVKSLKQQTYKNFEIHIYDNSCLPDGLSELAKQYPDVIIQKNSANIGFAGGNNSVMRKLLKDPSYKYLVLLNDDTNPDPSWLKSLIDRAEMDSKTGAVTSKLVFYEPFIRVEGNSKIINLKREDIAGDDRDLGIKLYEDTILNTSTYSRKFLRKGCYGFENNDGVRYTWTSGEFSLDIPIGTKDFENYILKLHVKRNDYIEKQELTIKIGDFKKEIDLLDEKLFEIPVPKAVIQKNKFDIIQNASSGLTGQFNGYDIGNLNNQPEVDVGQYDTAKEAVMICGGAVLFRADALRQVGIFDEYFFVYYEDADLSFRIKRGGWKLMYEPKAKVRHIHAGSSTEYSPLFSYHVGKNKPAFVLKNFGLRPNLIALKEIIWGTLKAFIEAAKKMFRNATFNSMLKIQLKSFCKFIINIPLIILKRFSIVKSV